MGSVAGCGGGGVICDTWDIVVEVVDGGEGHCVVGVRGRLD